MFALTLCLFFAANLVSGQIRPRFEASLSGYAGSAGSGDSLSFWAVTNRHGLVPAFAGGLLTLGVHSDGMEKIGSSAWRFGYGASFAGQLSALDGAKLMIDNLFASAAWKKIRLDVGMKYRGSGVQENEFNGTGIANGNVALSGNARNFPGYGIMVEPMAVPFTKRHLWLFGSFGDYMLLDDRYVTRPLLHNQALYARVDITRRFDLTIGFDHWALWSGTNPDGSRNPSGLKNYIHIIFCQPGGADATLSDQANVLGNHLGRTLVRMAYHADDYDITFSKDTPYEDGSGIGWQNFPDGVWSLYLGMKDKDRWVSDVIYEFIYTKWQSGEFERRVATEEEKAKQDPKDLHYGYIILGGGDSYFTHSSYRSGWTYYGMTLGLPLITLANNRIAGHHIDIKGKIARKAPYRLMFTYTENYGKYRQTDARFTDTTVPLRQLSLGLDGEVPLSAAFGSNLPLAITYGLFYDRGQLLSNTFSATLGIKLQLIGN